MEKTPIFNRRISPLDIQQGLLHNAYFLSAIAALAERPDRIFKLFNKSEADDKKSYSVNILFKGKWQNVNLDEYIPVQENVPAFSKSKENDSLWVTLLEKAWAKLYGNYKKI